MFRILHFVVSFRRRHETDVGEELLNDEEITVDAAIADTFQKMMIKSSSELFDLAYNKVKRFIQTSIFEVTVSGSVLGCMLKVCDLPDPLNYRKVLLHSFTGIFLQVAANVKPQQTLEFFVPHLTQRIHSALTDRVDHKKVEECSKVSKS